MKEFWEKKRKTIILVISFLLILLIGLFFALKNQKFTKYEEINVRPLFIGELDEPYGEKTFSSPISENYKGVVVPTNMQTRIFLNFRQPVSFDSFSIFFKGDLHAVSSYLAEDFDVYYKDSLGEWEKIDQIRGSKSSVYQFYSPVTLSTDSINISISKTAFFDTVVYGDLKFYKKYKIGLIGGIKNFLFEQRKSLLAYLFYSFLFYILLFIPGYVALDLVKRKQGIFKDIEYKIVFAPIISIVILFLIALFYLLIGNLNILNFYWIIFVISCFLFLNNHLYKEVFSSKFLLFLIGSVLLITFLIQAHRDYLFNLQYIEKYLDELEFIPLRGGYYGYHADNIRQWRIAKLLLHKIPISGEQTEDYLMGIKPGEIFDRTPLLPMITAVVLRMFGESHFIYQRFLNVLAALYYGGFYLLLKTYFSKRVAKISSILILLNVPLTFLAINAEIYYKYFAIFPMLLAFILFLEEKGEKSFLIGALMGIGFLIHPMIIIFSTTLLLLYFLRYKLTSKFFKKTRIAFSVLIFLFVFWTLISCYLKSEAGIVATSSYLENMTTINKEAIVNKFANFANIFVANVLLKKPSGGEVQLMSREFWDSLIRFSIITNLTPVMFVLLLIYFKKNIKKDYEILLIAVIPLVFIIVLPSDYAFSWNFNVVYPFLIPCLLGYVTSRLVKRKRLVKLIAFGSYPVFMFISLYFVSGVFVKMKYTSLIVYGLFLGTILLYIFLSLFLIKMVRKNEL